MEQERASKAETASFISVLKERLSRVSAGQALLGTLLTCLRERGVHITRARLGLEIQHANVMGVAWAYRDGVGLEELLVKHDVVSTPTYQLSPVRPVKERLEREIRLRLCDPLLQPRFNLEAEYRDEGLTDYLVLGLRSTRARDDILSFSTDRPGGFTPLEVDLLRASQRVMEIRSPQVARELYAGLERDIEAVELDVERSIVTVPRPQNQLNSKQRFRLQVAEDIEIIRELGFRLSALERIETPIWIFDVHRMQLLWGNQSAMTLWNAASASELLGREFHQTTTAAMQHQIWMTFERVMRGEVVHEWVVIEPKGESKRVYLSHKLVHLSNGDPAILTEALKEPPAEQIVTLAANLALSLALFDESGSLESYNPSMSTLMGERMIRLRDCLGERLSVEELWSRVERGVPFHVENQLETVKGERWFRIELRQVANEANERQILASFFDITEQRIEHFELKRLAHTDILTQVKNRHGIIQQAEELLASGNLCSVIYVDFDGLKAVNDTHGHAFGDQLLVAAVRRMAECCEGKAEVGRVGGDEFLVLVSCDNPDLAETIRVSVGLPYFIEDVHVSLTASCGIASVHGQSQIDELMNSADLAMISAKRSGKNQVAQFESELRKRTLRLRHLNSGVRKAVLRGELRLVTQPIIDLETGRVSKGENLLRWQSKEFGSVSPAEFIPVAEEAGVAVEFGDFVLNEACRLLQDMKHELGFVLPHSVNISARELAESDFVTRVVGTVNTWGVNPANLVIEVTETSMIDRLEDAQELLQKLRTYGFKIALDDFGTGYSSLAYLHKLPLDIVKLDKSLVKDLPEQRPIAIVQFVTQLAKNLGAEVVGEGVETSVHRACLGELGCNLGQGYLFGRPLERADWLAYCQKHAVDAL